MNSSEVWNILEGLCAEENVALFDIERGGTSGAGLLRVFITRGKQGGIGHQECAQVSQRVLNHPRVEELLPGQTLLEVSSPGVNRKLTRREHFEDAVGERLKISYKPKDDSKQTVTGTLGRIVGDSLELLLEPQKKGAEPRALIVPFSSVQEARVDFLFR